MADAPSGVQGQSPLGVPGLSIRFEEDGDILKVDGYGGQRPSNRQGVWGRLTPPSGTGAQLHWGRLNCFFFFSLSAHTDMLCIGNTLT